MTLDEAKDIVFHVIKNSIVSEQEINDDMNLIGENAILDSMKLVEVCLELEDIADENGFEFDWTSDAAMSKSRSMFRNIASLAEEYSIQSEK